MREMVSNVNQASGEFNSFLDKYENALGAIDNLASRVSPDGYIRLAEIIERHTGMSIDMDNYLAQRLVGRLTFFAVLLHDHVDLQIPNDREKARIFIKRMSEDLEISEQIIYECVRISPDLKAALGG